MKTKIVKISVLIYNQEFIIEYVLTKEIIVI